MKEICNLSYVCEFFRNKKFLWLSSVLKKNENCCYCVCHVTNYYSFYSAVRLTKGLHFRSVIGTILVYDIKKLQRICLNNSFVSSNSRFFYNFFNGTSFKNDVFEFFYKMQCLIKLDIIIKTN